MDTCSRDGSVLGDLNSRFDNFANKAYVARARKVTKTLLYSENICDYLKSASCFTVNFCSSESIWKKVSRILTSSLEENEVIL